MGYILQANASGPIHTGSDDVSAFSDRPQTGKKLQSNTAKGVIYRGEREAGGLQNRPNQPPK